MQPFTVATWNTAGRAKPEMLALIERVKPDVLLLQEVKVETWPAWVGLDGWSGQAHGLAFRRREHGEGGARSLGAAILVRTKGGLLHGDVVKVDGVAQPERVVTGTVFAPCCGIPITLLGYHALNGERGTDGLDKPRTTMAVGNWLAAQTGPVIAGMDANSPVVDHPDESRIECCFQDAKWNAQHMEPTMLGPNPSHPLRDVWRTYLRDHPGQARPLFRYQPSGPLAVTHFTGGKRAKYPVRYDHIWATPDFDVLDVQHLRDGFAAGSDHAMVLATLAHNPPMPDGDLPGEPDQAVAPAQ